jgi:hypothetical protein
VVEVADPAVAEVPVTVVALLGSPRDVLVDRARSAELLVVGHRGDRAPDTSVGLHCVRHASCPVRIVRSEPAQYRPMIGAVTPTTW